MSDCSTDEPAGRNRNGGFVFRSVARGGRLCRKLWVGPGAGGLPDVCDTSGLPLVPLGV